jgi:hypothetical protein
MGKEAYFFITMKIQFYKILSSFLIYTLVAPMLLATLPKELSGKSFRGLVFYTTPQKKTSKIEPEAKPDQPVEKQGWGAWAWSGVKNAVKGAYSAVAGSNSTESKEATQIFQMKQGLVLNLMFNTNPSFLKKVFSKSSKKPEAVWTLEHLKEGGSVVSSVSGEVKVKKEHMDGKDVFEIDLVHPEGYPVLKLLTTLDQVKKKVIVVDKVKKIGDHKTLQQFDVEHFHERTYKARLIENKDPLGVDQIRKILIQEMTQ